MLRLILRSLGFTDLPESIKLPGVPTLPMTELPVLDVFDYIPVHHLGAHRIPALTDPPVVVGVLSHPVTRGKRPVGELQLVRLEPGLPEAQLDGIATRMATALGGQTSVTPYGGTRVHTVLGVSLGYAIGSGIVFRRGDDVVIIRSGDADSAWEIAGAYLDATAVR